MGPRISDRIGAIKESATLAITAKAKELRAAGEPVIGFGAGEPDFPTPAHIVDAAVAACTDPANHKYTPSSGLPDLRAAIAAKTARDSGFECEATNVIVTNGGKQAVANAFAVLCDPGDEVIVPTPYWTTYPEAIALTGAVTVPVVTTVASGFRASVDQLEARVRAVLRRVGHDGRPGPLVVGELTIDATAREAFLNGEPLELSPKEFDLLRFLAERPGHVVSKRELLAEVWRQPYGGSEKTVDVHLSWLRKKLGETAADSKYLHTVFGVGVKLVEPA